TRWCRGSCRSLPARGVCRPRRTAARTGCAVAVGGGCTRPPDTVGPGRVRRRHCRLFFCRKGAIGLGGRTVVGEHACGGIPDTTTPVRLPACGRRCRSGGGLCRRHVADDPC